MDIIIRLEGELDMEKILNSEEDLRKFLYIRGFLFTNDSEINETIYPFYSNWKKDRIMSYNLYTHRDQKSYIYNDKKASFVIVGHAYNPFSGEHSEKAILEIAAEKYNSNKEMFFEFINELTGVFLFMIVEQESVVFFNDASGMQTVFYGEKENKIYISSHSKLIGDILGLEISPYVKRLISYKFYKLFGKMLPGDISPYDGFYRVIPNFYIRFSNKQFKASRLPGIFLNTDISYEETVEKIADILCKSMEIIPKKWRSPAISLTGGCDSKTTLSCANGLYDKFSYFSYDSQDSEKVDAVAAKKICDLLNIEHKLYYISRNNSDFDGFDIYQEILKNNCGCIGKNNENDIRKRIFFVKNNDFDVEVKSWVSEIGRAYYHKRFLKKNFPKRPTPRYLSSLYKVFVHNRKLLKETDIIFKEFLDKYYNEDIFKTIPWYDIIFWEYRVGAWNGLVISGEHNISFDITIPYNNRKLLLLFLSTPLEKRIKDEVHKDVMKLKNEKVYKSGISVTNVKHTNKRAKIERLYLEVQSKLPF